MASLHLWGGCCSMRWSKGLQTNVRNLVSLVSLVFRQASNKLSLPQWCLWCPFSPLPLHPCHWPGGGVAALQFSEPTIFEISWIAPRASELPVLPEQMEWLYSCFDRPSLASSGPVSHFPHFPHFAFSFTVKTGDPGPTPGRARATLHLGIRCVKVQTQRHSVEDGRVHCLRSGLHWRGLCGFFETKMLP